MAWTAPRTWVAGNVLTAAQLNTDVRDNLSVLSTALLVPEHISNAYYGPVATTIDATKTVDVNLLYAVPLHVPATATYNQIAIHVVTGVAGNARMGIYNDSSGVPGALVLDAGTVSTTAAAFKTITISQSLTGPAKYWLAVVFDAQPAVVAVDGTGLYSWGNGAFTDPAYVGISRAFTYAALPDPFGSPGLTSNMPLVAVRKS